MISFSLKRISSILHCFQIRTLSSKHTENSTKHIHLQTSMADKPGFETSAGAPACKLYKKPNLREDVRDFNEIQNGKVQTIPGGVEVMSVDVTQGYEAILHYNGKSYTYGPGAHNVIHAPHHKVMVDSVQIVESAEYVPADDVPTRG